MSRKMFFKCEHVCFVLIQVRCILQRQEFIVCVILIKVVVAYQ